ncbi:MAG: U32 family peptidase, partial [Lentisphaeria bacterium]|nr:U32 family peptidase [Lentisphaeria bacterium]
MTERPMPELLAPAGNLSCALAAVGSGADAVYCGLKKFNARERTENFSFDEMSKLISYARKYGKRVYVTFNTLVKENEIPEAASFLARLDALRPDALIVQDLG